MSHKPGGRLPLLSAWPAVTLTTLNRAAASFAAWWTEARWVWSACLRLLPDPAALQLWFEPRPYSARVQHTNHSSTEPLPSDIFGPPCGFIPQTAPQFGCFCRANSHDQQTDKPSNPFSSNKLQFLVLLRYLPGTFHLCTFAALINHQLWSQCLLMLYSHSCLLTTCVCMFVQLSELLYVRWQTRSRRSTLSRCSLTLRQRWKTTPSVETRSASLKSKSDVSTSSAQFPLDLFCVEWLVKLNQSIS